MQYRNLNIRQNLATQHNIKKSTNTEGEKCAYV